MNTTLQHTTSPGVRLRNSCDSCNAAKVKCSKQRPCCRRCEQKDLRCVYSVSLRSSKRGAERIARRSSASQQFNNNTGIGNPNYRGRSGSNSGNTINFSLPLDTSAFPATSLYDFPPAPISEVNFDLPLDDYFSTDGSLSSLPEQTPSLSDGSLLPPHQQHNGFESYAHAAPNTPLPPPSAPSAPRALLCGCQQSVLSKLSELSLTTAASGAALPFDRALSENRAIVALCTSTLDCAACARSDSVMLVMTLGALLAHVLVVFDALLRQRLQPRDRSRSLGDFAGDISARRNTDAQYSALELLSPPPSARGSVDGSIHGSKSSGSSTSEKTKVRKEPPPVRLSLGMYELDERDEQILQTNLLKIELGKITAVVEGFETRLSRMGSGPAVVGDGTNETKLHQDVVLYLKQNLRVNYDVLKRLMNASGQGEFWDRGGGGGRGTSIII